MAATEPIRAKRLGAYLASAKRGVQRTDADSAEIARRVRIYTRQVATTGRIAWLPHRSRER
jgi:hypothetical protein